MSLAFMDNYARIRKMLYAPLPKPKPAPKLEIVAPEIARPVQRYIVAIQGPCQPDHKYFDIYNGGRDVLHIQSDVPKIKIEDCIDFIVAQSGISKTLLLGSQRTQDFVTARHQAMWLAREYTGKSLPEIGRRFGGRDHTTILHGVRKREALKASGDWVPPSIEEVATFARSRKQ